MTEPARKERQDPTLDGIHHELVEVTNSACSEIPSALQRLSVAAEGMKREGRLVRLEARKARNSSNPSLPRPQIGKAGGSTK